MCEKWRVTKVGAAIEQLEWAIHLVVEHEAYLPAITLAGAAEEILGRAPGVFSSFQELRDALAASNDVPSKIVADDHLNRAKNWLKHWSPNHSPELVIELQTEAVLYIVRGLTNLSRAGAPDTPMAQRFYEWVADRCPDLLHGGG